MRLLTSIALLLAACAGTAPPATIENTSFDPRLNVDLPASTKTADGLYYRDLVTGTGAPLTAGQMVSVHYVGALPNGTVFDARTGSAPTYDFQLGVHDVIQGWDEGLLGAAVGSTRQLIIPPSLGYGPYAVGGLPPNSILVFTVAIVSAQ
ncbi:MAG: FKBP-type peptidyl-prolyl cis-trans isomerase [Myxococcales bacterium]|nr:FKBP-type peptidyl-prolyl cis-trans isomerase [Myxococcales bacterium]